MTVVPNEDGSYEVQATLTVENLKSHTNGAGNAGYWIGFGISQAFYVDGTTIREAAYWGANGAPDTLTSVTVETNTVRDNTYVVNTVTYDTYYYGYVKDSAKGNLCIKAVYSKSGCTDVTVIYNITPVVTLYEAPTPAISEIGRASCRERV